MNSHSFRTIKSPWGEQAISTFLEGYFYAPEVFLINEISLADKDAGAIEAMVQPHSELYVSKLQRGPIERHPRHVSGADMLMMTVSLGSLHAYFFHDCLWEEGWVGFGNRMELVEFKSMANLKEPLILRSKEVRSRRGSSRALFDLQFEFQQSERIVYQSRQTALFVRNK